MNRATLYRMSDTVILGELMTTDRFWGGPDSIALYFVLECNRPFTSADGWNEKGVMPARRPSQAIRRAWCSTST